MYSIKNYISFYFFINNFELILHSKYANVFLLFIVLPPMRERVVLFMVRFVVHDFECTVDLLKQHDPKNLVRKRQL